MHIIYTKRIENGNTYADKFTCNTYSYEDGCIDFYSTNLMKRYFISIHKMDCIVIETVDGKTIKEEEKGVEIKCTT